jgi:hypothetical protein
MADFLTEKNGVVCTTCFVTIDLTKTKPDEPTKWLKRFDKLFRGRNWFTVTCPHCQQKHSYLYSEVRPISNLTQKLDELKKDEDSTPQFRSQKYDN